ncbi:hypothetical protein Scep_019327 [Stephania cephalantha]|uniref:Uncharacterized protein n=1 Tax=Stephania cephalantha TaxID=152367 RepID=A0AAP0IAL7_9MAGN
MTKDKKMLREINKTTTDRMANLLVVNKLPPKLSPDGTIHHQKVILADEEGNKVQAQYLIEMPHCMIKYSKSTTFILYQMLLSIQSMLNSGVS